MFSTAQPACIERCGSKRSKVLWFVNAVGNKPPAAGACLVRWVRGASPSGGTSRAVSGVEAHTSPPGDMEHQSLALRTNDTAPSGVTGRPYNTVVGAEAHRRSPRGEKSRSSTTVPATRIVVLTLESRRFVR